MNLHIKSLLGALAFSLLFYSKSFGLNTILLSVIVLVLMTSFGKQRKVPWGFSLAYLTTAVMVFIDPTPFKIFIHLMAFLVFVGKSISEKSSLYLSWLIGTVNMLIASIAALNRYLNRRIDHKKRLSTKTAAYIKALIVALSLVVLFTFLYQNANPVFGDLIARIDFSFISVPWVFFTLLGYLFFLHVLRPYYPKELIGIDARQANELPPPTAPFTIPVLERLKGEQTMGSMVLMALNLLLLLFLTTDIIYLYQAEPISNLGYSQSVHQGVYALMFSIVCAIALILYFFRGDLNFYLGNKRIKIFCYVWIGLNVVLVGFTWYKNYQYVEALGLTYKRIGVFMYLLLTLTGLVTTFIKVQRKRSFVFLLRSNIAALGLFLLISSAIPWDRAITSYNLQQIEHPDMAYLVKLGESNSGQLYQYTKRNDTKLTQDLESAIKKKHSAFLTAQKERTWQEYTLYQLKPQQIR